MVSFPYQERAVQANDAFTEEFAFVKMSGSAARRLVYRRSGVLWRSCPADGRAYESANTKCA